jgi:hypothetical protein
MTAPVQVLVIGLDGLEFDGSVLAELDRLRDAGTVRLLDVLLVARAADGAFSTLPPPPGLPHGTGAVVARLLGTSEEHQAAPAAANAGAGASEKSAAAPPQGPDAVWSLDGAVPPGRTAAVALIEHLWAEPLQEAIRTAGGSPLGETWLAPDDLDRLEKLTVDE